eukprot:6036504-Alexandrium_andersonii.AAC.1
MVATELCTGAVRRGSRSGPWMRSNPASQVRTEGPLLGIYDQTKNETIAPGASPGGLPPPWNPPVGASGASGLSGGPAGASGAPEAPVGG